MSETNPQAPGKIKLFCCGGAGINIGSNFDNFRHHKEAGLSSVECVYLDTSHSNLKPSLDPESIYVLPDVDGSGKERGQNSAHILKHVKEMLQKHRPTYVNVILSSASGGSGAVIGAVLAKELMEKDEMVISITVGVSDSGAEIKNTLDTLKTYEGLVAATKKPIAVAYFENNRETPPSKVDEQIAELITAISVVFSRENEGLDTRDLYNFLNFERMTDYTAHACGLKMYNGKLRPEDHADTMTVASVVTNKDNRGIDFVIPYTCYGVLPAEVSPEINDRSPLHLATKAFPFNDIAKTLKESLAEMKRVAEARTAQSEVLSGGEQLSNGFLAL